MYSLLTADSMDGMNAIFFFAVRRPKLFCRTARPLCNLKPFELSSPNFIQISINIRLRAECESGNLHLYFLGCVCLLEWAKLLQWTTGMDFYMQT